MECRFRQESENRGTDEKQSRTDDNGPDDNTLRSMGWLIRRRFRHTKGWPFPEQLPFQTDRLSCCRGFCLP